MQSDTKNLGARSGRFCDWATQRWVQLTGRKLDLNETSWLRGPVGDVDIIGTDFFLRLADRLGLVVDSETTPRGLLDSFNDLAGPNFNPAEVDPRIAAFYEKTSESEFDVWSKWSTAFRPFGGLLASLFSRRLQQLNVPLSPLDTNLGISSEILKLRDTAGTTQYTAWVREVISTRRTLYAGSYSICEVPGYDGPCVKVVFPLPNGSANVIMRPESASDGSLTVHSSGKKFGDPGFYFVVHSSENEGWTRYVASLKESIRVYVDGAGITRADHNLQLWGLTFLRIHYRMRTRDAA